MPTVTHVGTHGHYYNIYKVYKTLYITACTVQGPAALYGVSGFTRLVRATSPRFRISRFNIRLL